MAKMCIFFRNTLILRGDLNIFAAGKHEKLTRLCSGSMNVLLSKSSSRSRD